MSYRLKRLLERLRQKIWPPYEDYMSNEVVAYIGQFEQPIPEWKGGFVAGTTVQFDPMNCVGVRVSMNLRDAHGKRVHYESLEMLAAESDNIIAREAYERMRMSGLWRLRWLLFRRKIDLPVHQREVERALNASFAMIPPRKVG